MNRIIREKLFEKHFLVSDAGEDQVEALYALQNKLNIRIADGFELANVELVRFAASMLGEYVPSPFYQGFPQSVRELTPDQRLLDQMIHYTRTYGFGNFHEAGHSLFETVYDRSDFDEKDDPKEFRIITERQAFGVASEIADGILQNSRPFNGDQLSFVVSMIEDGWEPNTIASKQNAVEILVVTKKMRFASDLRLPDVIKLVDYINFEFHNCSKLNKIHLSNSERKLVTKVIDMLADDDVTVGELRECVEKRNIWKGLLHLIHYTPKTETARYNLNMIYTDWFRSAYSTFEKTLHTQGAEKAAEYIADAKGNGALLRNLNYLLQNADDVESVLDRVAAKNPMIIMQMQNMYRNYNEGPRFFKFTKHNTARHHRELERKNFLQKETRDQAIACLEDKLKEALSGRAGKVYIAPGMERIAVPTNMSAGESGFGIMSTGSRIKLPEGKNIRAFTYWEKVNDIDLACFGIDADGTRKEFSWRTMWSDQTAAVTYSGDETSGYYGGSEYFDIDFEALREEYPTMKYMVFTNNVFSGTDFANVVCRAGWMARDVEDSGEIYEPKTVRSAYTINAKTTFCYLYAIDIETREVIWLNVADSSRQCVAGASEFDWLYDYFTLTDTMNMRKLFEYAAKEIVANPDEADLVVGDIHTDKEQIHSYDMEKVAKFLM